MKTIFDEAGTGKDVQRRYATLQNKRRKPTDPATAALASVAASLTKVAPDARLHVVVAVAEHESEPVFKADLSITSAPSAARTA